MVIHGVAASGWSKEHMRQLEHTFEQVFNWSDFVLTWFPVQMFGAEAVSTMALLRRLQLLPSKESKVYLICTSGNIIVAAGEIKLHTPGQ